MFESPMPYGIAIRILEQDVSRTQLNPIWVSLACAASYGKDDVGPGYYIAVQDGKFFWNLCHSFS